MWLFHKRPRDDSFEALEEAQESLRQAKARDSDVHEIAASLRTMRETNNFAERLQSIMGGGENQ